MSVLDLLKRDASGRIDFEYYFPDKETKTKENRPMNNQTYRDARNESTGAQSDMDMFVHLTTEAALNQAQGLPVDKQALLLKLGQLAASAAENAARCIALIVTL